MYIQCKILYHLSPILLPFHKMSIRHSIINIHGKLRKNPCISFFQLAQTDKYGTYVFPSSANCFNQYTNEVIYPGGGSNLADVSLAADGRSRW